MSRAASRPNGASARFEVRAAHSLSPWLLVQSEFGSRRIRENGKCARTWGDVCSWRQHPAARCFDLCERVRNIIHHDVHARPFVWRSVALLHPCAAHAARVVERERTVATLSHGPAKDAAIEAGRRFCRYRWDFKVTDLAVGHITLQSIDRLAGRQAGPLAVRRRLRRIQAIPPTTITIAPPSTAIVRSGYMSARWKSCRASQGCVGRRAFARLI